MELTVRLIDISTGDSPVVLITRKAALTHDLHNADRVLLTCGERQAVAVVNTTNTGFNGVMDDEIGMFLEAARALEVSDGAKVSLVPVSKPDTIKYIRKKMDNQELSAEEMHAIVQDIVERKITEIELTYFVAACSINPLSFGEIVSLTKAMSETGQRLNFGDLVIDKHCIGGVPGNRTSMITVPIMASLGYIVPKTSSRAITSPAGTADTMEVLTEVNIPIDRMKQIVKKVGGCLVWGGSVNLAPADDRIIRIERPLSIDVPGLMTSSVLAKKSCVGSTHVVIDIPYGAGAKVQTLAEAEQLRRLFSNIGGMLGMKMLVIITDGSQPIGNGIGPVLEVYDVLAVLKNDPHAPEDLRKKSLMIAGKLLEFVGRSKKGQGWKLAQEELDSGKAYAKFQEIIDAQGRKEIPPLAKFTYDVRATDAGSVKAIDNSTISKIARIAGAPFSKGAGVLLYTKVGAAVERNDKLFAIYAESEEKLANAVSFVKTNAAYRF
jgi:thymidine phosphorylase